MSNTVKATSRAAGAVGGERGSKQPSLYTAEGRRKYLNRAERQRTLAAMAELDEDRALFALTLAWTGARISEVLALTRGSFQADEGVVSVRTLKRRMLVMREVPIPPELMGMLDIRFALSSSGCAANQNESRLWPWSRVTGWRIIKHVMHQAGIVGRHACPKAFRHAFGVGTLQSGIPITLTRRWLGHARMTTTEIYVDVCGPEEVAFASQFWRESAGSFPTAAIASHATPEI